MYPKFFYPSVQKKNRNISAIFYKLKMNSIYNHPQNLTLTISA